ncbi:MAG: DUF2695 domain-containing protein [Pirellulales bacterium]|nr:DUF2695 domain-containing protein [Pirellulales bacterium]
MIGPERAEVLPAQGIALGKGKDDTKRVGPTDQPFAIMDSDKKAKLKAWHEQEKKKLLDSIPMSHADLRDLFALLDREDASPCDHTLRETIEFLEKRKLDVDKIVPWLQEHGGYCDCEVIYNVESEFGELIDDN